MDKIVTENLFLLEFLVDKVDIQCNDPCMPCMTENICVSVQFLDNAPLDICDDDFQSASKSECGGKESVKSGKSCLFSLTPEQACDASKQFDVFVNIYQKAEPGVLPDKVPIGCSLISIVNLFNELIESVAESTGQSPTAKTLKDTFEIRGPTCEVIGCLSMYIRMSCFGKLIVTQFQMNLSDKTVLFKDKEGHSLYRYKKAKKSGSDVCSSQNGKGGMFGSSGKRGPSNPNCPRTPCFGGGGGGGCAGGESYGGGGYGGGGGSYGGGGGGCNGNNSPQYDTPCNECGRMGGPEPPPCGYPMGGGNQYGALQQYRGGAAAPQEDDPPGNYEEIGASMGGNKLTLRVHKDNRIEQVGECADSGSCACTVENIGNKNAFSGQVQVAPCQGGGGNQMAMSPASNDRPFQFKVGTCNGGGGAGQNAVTMAPPMCTAKDGTQYAELSDPNKEVFILRIGKKSEGANKKNNLELELCTPKGPELKPPPQKCTRDTQFDPALSGVEKGGKGKKGGKGGGKGKKGKKK